MNHFYSFPVPLSLFVQCARRIKNNSVRFIQKSIYGFRRWSSKKTAPICGSNESRNKHLYEFENNFYKRHEEIGAN